ncbi:glycosyltransferase family 9 protein [Knoellia sp. CPCC 206435]|uniref:glycosyltransferase family 9 protein n=1 Tax=Knoellia terrae TaxID=3404797 RepID=UPI003B42FFBC
MSTVLALRALGLGDALTGVPALRGLRRRWPDAELVLAASPAVGGWLRSLGVVDRVHPATGLDPLGWPGAPPDVAVNLHGRGPQSHLLLAALRPGDLLAFDCPEAGVTGPRWLPEEHEVDRWIRLVHSAGGSCSADDLRLATSTPRAGHVLLHPGAAARSRRWPVERWVELASVLASWGRTVVVTGTATEQCLCRAVAATGAENRCGRDDLASLSDLVASATLVVCGDTGVAHLATAHATPSVLLFGPVAPALWGPRTDPHLHRVLWEPHPADPAGDPHGDAPDPRLLRITVGRVLDAAESLLEAAALSRPRAPAS